jgi:hypothetical protein
MKRSSHLSKESRAPQLTKRSDLRRVLAPVNFGRGRAIEVEIRQLVLHGFNQADRQPIAEAIERELRTLLADNSLSIETSFEVRRVNGGSFQMEANARHESSGTNIARAIVGGLRQ